MFLSFSLILRTKPFTYTYLEAPTSSVYIKTTTQYLWNKKTTMSFWSEWEELEFWRDLGVLKYSPEPISTQFKLRLFFLWVNLSFHGTEVMCEVLLHRQSEIPWRVHQTSVHGFLSTRHSTDHSGPEVVRWGSWVGRIPRVGHSAHCNMAAGPWPVLGASQCTQHNPNFPWSKYTAFMFIF